MMILNFDCWRVVFDHLEPETRTLYSCLFVSKEFFHLSTRVLYRRPICEFDGQDSFSPFSKSRLANLLGICTGFISSVSVAHEVVEKQQQSSSTTTLTATTTTTTTSNTATMTINYYKLVQEYSPHPTVQRDFGNQWPSYVNCFAETITNLHFVDQDFDIILKLVPRFRVLKSVYVNPPLSPSSSAASTTTTANMTTSDNTNNDYLTKVVQFIRFHRQLFPGVLTTLDASDVLNDWKESAQIQESMGDIVNQWIVIKSGSKQDLSRLVVSRLKNLKLTKNNEYFGLESRAMDLLKRCHGLKTLHVVWSQGKVFDWSSLMVEKKITTRNHCGILSLNHDIVNQHQQKQQQQQQQPQFGLQHLIVRGNATMAAEAMKVFKDTLESVEIRWPTKNNVPQNSILDWGKSCTMSKLKSIRLHQSNLCLENLISGCPRLEVLDLECHRYKSISTWSSILGTLPVGLMTTTTPTITATSTTISFLTSLLPISLRKLSLIGCSADGFDPRWLKSLKNLEDLRLEVVEKKPFRRTTMINMTKDLGWWFPRLRSVALFGRFAVQIQGQILWVAPKLESLTLGFGFQTFVGLLDIDTFLFPPVVLDTEKRIARERKLPINNIGNGSGVVEATKPNSTTTTTTTTAATTTKTTTTTDPSDASFPILKSLKLQQFQYSNSQMTDQIFGEIFFGPRSTYQSSIVLEINNGDGVIIDQKRFLFPNLEHLELDLDVHHNSLRPTVLHAMLHLPKLERIQFREGFDTSRLYYAMSRWLQEIPGDESGPSHETYRSRPLAAMGNGSDSDSTGGSSPLANRCVIQFFRPEGIRYQLIPHMIPKAIKSLRESKKK